MSRPKPAWGDEMPAAAPEGSRLAAPPVVHDYGLVHDCMNAGVKQVRDTPALQSIRQEFLFCLKHVSKRRYGLVFVSCQDVNCKCPGELADWNSSFMTELGSLGGTLPTPTPSADPDRYKTLKDHFESSERPFADQHCPSRISKNLGWCERCPSYVFTSVTNANHHQSLLHGNVSCDQPHFIS